MNINEIIVPIVGVLSTAGIWQYLQFRQKHKLETQKYHDEASPDVLYRNDLKQRVNKLEQLLEESSREKDEMRLRIEQLVGEVAKLRVEVEYLKKENDRLKDRL